MEDEFKGLLEFPEFAKAVLSALAREATTDPELFVLTTSGLLLASRIRILRGLGIALAGWYVTRRADAYMTVIDSKMSLLAGVISAGNAKEANEN